MIKPASLKRHPFGRAGTVCVLVSLVAVTGCMTVNTGVPSRPAPVQTTPSQSGIEGSWRSTENLYTASFFNNATQWTEVGTGALLISGSYSRVSDRDYSMQLTSAVSGETRATNCRLANINTLNCTRDDGNQFSMVRSTGAFTPSPVT